MDLYVKCLALCHSVIVEKDEFKNLEYHASSMDEKALINGARYLNYIYLKKDIHNTIYLEINNQEHKFKLLNMIEFDSKRKRMSVIVKDSNSGKIILFMKGSDSSLRALTTKNREYLKINEEYLIDFSSQGLRNFNIGFRYIDENEYNEWEKIYKVIQIKIYFKTPSKLQVF
jgi:magnesium-transporting ATPase (P-type)